MLTEVQSCPPATSPVPPPLPHPHLPPDLCTCPAMCPPRFDSCYAPSAPSLSHLSPAHALPFTSAHLCAPSPTTSTNCYVLSPYYLPTPYPYHLPPTLLSLPSYPLLCPSAYPPIPTLLPPLPSPTNHSYFLLLPPFYSPSLLCPISLLCPSCYMLCLLHLIPLVSRQVCMHLCSPSGLCPLLSLHCPCLQPPRRGGGGRPRRSPHTRV